MVLDMEGGELRNSQRIVFLQPVAVVGLSEGIITAERGCFQPSSEAAFQPLGKALLQISL